MQHCNIMHRILHPQHQLHSSIGTGGHSLRLPNFNHRCRYPLNAMQSQWMSSASESEVFTRCTWHETILFIYCVPYNWSNTPNQTLQQSNPNVGHPKCMVLILQLRAQPLRYQQSMDMVDAIAAPRWFSSLQQEWRLTCPVFTLHVQMVETQDSYPGSQCWVALSGFNLTTLISKSTVKSKPTEHCFPSLVLCKVALSARNMLLTECKLVNK